MDNQNVAKNGFYDMLCMVPKKKVILFIIFSPEGAKYFRRGESLGLQKSKNNLLSKIPITKWLMC